MRPRSSHETTERAKLDGDWQHHLCEFLDAFYGAHGNKALQESYIAQAPDYLGHTQADAFLGGSGEHLARRWGLPIPGWIREERRYLLNPMFVPDEKPPRAYLIGTSPVAFRSRLIFTGPEPLQRARFPYGRDLRPRRTSSL